MYPISPVFRLLWWGVQPHLFFSSSRVLVDSTRMSVESPPRFIYKIVPSPPGDPFPKEHPLSELDQNDGFVHLSTSTQVPKTAGLFFARSSSLWVIKLEFKQFADSIRWEGGFPHLYGNFGADNVDSTVKFVRQESQTWGEVMAKSEWLN